MLISYFVYCEGTEQLPDVILRKRILLERVLSEREGRYRRMPCHKIINRNKKNISVLQTIQNISYKKVPLVNSQSQNCGRASFYASLKSEKGSLTIEAAVVLPLLFLGMVALICIMDLLRIQAQTSISLNESVKELGMYAYVTEKTPADVPVGQISQAICIGYAQTKLRDEPNADISLSSSSYKDHIIELRASGTYKMPITIFPISTIYFQNRVRIHDWTGYSGYGSTGDTDTGGEMVYITDRQTVYHAFSDCTHIDLSIEQISYDKVGQRRNENGGKYYACPHCVSVESHSGAVYIARSGDRYHTNPDCQSLKRMVQMVLKSEIEEGMQLCSRCGKRQ